MDREQIKKKKKKFIRGVERCQPNGWQITGTT